MYFRLFLYSVLQIFIFSISSISHLSANNWEAVVPNNGSNNLSVIELLANSQIVNTFPNTTTSTLLFKCAITPNGKTAYIASTNTLPPASVIPFDLTSKTFGTPIPLQLDVKIGEDPFEIAITPNGRKAYVTCSGSKDVWVINLRNNTISGRIPIGVGSTSGIAISPNGRRGYVANGLSTVEVIDILLDIPIGFVSTAPQNPLLVSVTPDGTNALVVSVDNLNNAFISYLDLSDNTLSSFIALPGKNPSDIAISADGSMAYVSLQNPSSIIPVNIATATPLTPINLGGIPNALAISPDDLTIYVSLANGTVIPIDVATGGLGSPDSVGVDPTDIAITPDQAPIAAFTFIGPCSLDVTFDASTSSSPVGTITNYEWDFGDTTSFSTQTPIISHSYSLPGTYVVRLTVRNSAGTSTTQVFTGQTVSRNGGAKARTMSVITVDNPKVFPPKKVHGYQKPLFIHNDKFENVLSWRNPSKGHHPVSYEIYSDAALTQRVGKVKAKSINKFEIHNVAQGNYIYYIVSIDKECSKSCPATVFVSAFDNSSS